MPNGRRQSRRRKNSRRGGRAYSGPGAITRAINIAAARRPIRVPLSGFINLTTDGSGVLAGVATCDPSGGTGSSWTSIEYSGYSTKYTLVRCVALRCQFVSNLPFSLNETKSTTSPVVISANINSVSAPTTYDAVGDNAGSKVWNAVSDTSKSGYQHFLSHDLKRLGFISTSASRLNTSDGTYMGCAGSIGWYASALPISTRIGTVFVTGVYEFLFKS